MQTEVEVKFLDIDPDVIRSRLKALDAKLTTPERLMRRIIFDSPKFARGQWVRLRDEGDRVTLTYKQINNQTISGTQEINLVVDNYDATIGFLAAIGLEAGSSQETKRESWQLGEVQIEIDTWPWIEPFIELEGPSESKLKQAASKLELDWSAHIIGSVTPVYQRKFDFDPADLDRYPVTFGPVPNWMKAK